MKENVLRYSQSPEGRNAEPSWSKHGKRLQGLKCRGQKKAMSEAGEDQNSWRYVGH